MNIAIVDDERWPADDLAQFVASLGHTTMTFYSAQDALEALRVHPVDLVISDVTMPGMDGLELVRQTFEQKIPVQFILVSGKDEVVRTINAMELGVLDFLTKPTDIRQLAHLIEQYEEHRDTETLDLSEYGEAGLFSRESRNLYRKLRKLQEFPQIPVLIQGETGTGKEVLARFLHHQNPLVSGPFIAINCSALSHDLFEAELFGYEGGAFTGAERRGKPGKITLARDGTLFMDEITELTPELQAKLLRVLQERAFFPVGGTRQLSVDTRIVCATNEDIAALVHRGVFREDLFYRLNVCRVTIPPLRDRREEILPLAWMFLRRLAVEFSHGFTRIAPDARRLLEGYHWRGNIREMRNILTNIAIFEEGTEVTRTMVERHLTGQEQLTPSGAGSPAGAGSPDDSPREPLREHGEHPAVLPVNGTFRVPEEPFDLDSFTRSIVCAVLHHHRGNRSAAARHLGLTRNQLYGRFRDLDC